MGNKITAEQARRFFNKEITQEELFGEEAREPKKEAMKRKREEDAIQAAAIAWFQSRWPHIPIYGNATANIFNSGGLYRKALPKGIYPVAASLGIKANTWGYLLDHALSKLGLKLTIQALERDQEGAKFAQMRRTKELGAVRSWPDIQICFASKFQAKDHFDDLHNRQFHGLFIELKKPDASSLPWGKNDNGSFSTNEHLQSQAKTLSDLVAQGYMAAFAVGLDEFKAIVELYMGVHEDDHFMDLQSLRLKDVKELRFIHRLRKEWK